jgi:LysR family transcriptional regulator, glycine cleavage system transcriptional activator
MRARLPPLFSIQVFEVAARQGNFSRAAVELHITQSAVSRQIQLLEHWCDQRLFARLGPKVQLTQAGHDLLARLSAPLNALHHAFDPGESAHHYLTVNTLASTARAWLVPRLHRFHAGNPQVTLHLQTDYALINPPPHIAMLAIRHGPAPKNTSQDSTHIALKHTAQSELHSEHLFSETLLAVAAPNFALAIGADPARWQSAAMLRHTSLDWSIWLDGIGVVRSEPASGSAFNDASVLLDAAAAGLGVALTRYSLAYPRLRDGQLVCAAAPRCASPSSHYAVCRKDCLENPAVQAFVQWLRVEAQQWEAQQIRKFTPQTAEGAANTLI